MPRFPRNDIIALVGSQPRFDLAESLGPNLSLNDLLETLPSDFGDMPLAYGTAPGGQALRAAIARAHGVRVDDVVVTVGGMQALFLTAFVLCERGDEAIVAGPLLPMAANVLAAAGATTLPMALGFERRYQPDLGEFRKMLSPRTRIVSLASPQNPSGVAIPGETLREMIAMMKSHAPNAWMVMDETYREAAYGGDAVAPSAASLDDRVLVVASLSKCHGAPGLRIGWVITRDAELRDQLVTAKFNTVISCSPIDEALACEVFAQRDRIIGAGRERLAAGLDLVESWVQENSPLVDWVRPDAGALCCIRLSPDVFDDAGVERFYAELDRASVRVARGNWFGDAPRVFRLGFGWLSAADFREALERVTTALRRALSDASQ